MCSGQMRRRSISAEKRKCCGRPKLNVLGNWHLSMNLARFVWTSTQEPSSSAGTSTIRCVLATGSAETLSVLVVDERISKGLKCTVLSASGDISPALAPCSPPEEETYPTSARTALICARWSSRVALLSLSRSAFTTSNLRKSERTLNDPMIV
jgi:hypothetical protein